MARFFLDSVTLIRLGRGRAPEREWIATALEAGHELGVSGIVVTEVLTGAHPPEREGWLRVFSGMEYWPTSLDDAVDAGIRRYDLARGGIHVHLPDATIAAVARRVGATIVTDNVKDFAALDVPVLRLSG